MTGVKPYPPLNALKPLDDDLWIVDGPVVRMKYVVGSIPFSTRMTVVRLPDGKLWVHSPTELTADLQEAVAGLGPVAALVAPNKLHWSWLQPWQEAFPSAAIYAAPGVAEKADQGGFRVNRTLEAAAPALWAGAIDQALVPGDFMTEAVFFHRATATLILTDLIENFEPDHVQGALMKLMMRVGGVMAPRAGTPRDLMLTFLGKRGQAREAARTMIGWDPRRIIIAHGRIIEDDAPAVLRRAFAWTGV